MGEAEQRLPPAKPVGMAGGGRCQTLQPLIWTGRRTVAFPPPLQLSPAIITGLVPTSTDAPYLKGSPPTTDRDMTSSRWRCRLRANASCRAELPKRMAASNSWCGNRSRAYAAAQVRQRPATSMTCARGENLASATSSPRAPRMAAEVASTTSPQTSQIRKTIGSWAA
jgi:hypothetical protein